ncbi:MAG: glycosyltransferase family 2 protein [Candidatus Saccharibacteria bacterium]|nr:glycosyltransferase family 2 protein [Candidatus Saccharibacteria bacterium]
MLLFIPAYNCEKQLPRVLDKITQTIAEYFDEIIIINNRSTDRTESVALKYPSKEYLPLIHVLRNDVNYGLGGSHKVAFEYALSHKHDYIVVLHGDDQGDINDLQAVLESQEYQKHDCMLGARFMPDSRLKGYSRFRTLGNRVYNHLFSFVTHQPILDLGSGLNLYKVSSLKSHFYDKFPDHLTFNYYMILASHYYHQDISFFPISWRSEDQKSNVKLMSQALEVLHLLAKYKFNPNFIKSEHRSNPIDHYSYEVLQNGHK